MSEREKTETDSEFIDRIILSHKLDRSDVSRLENAPKAFQDHCLGIAKKNLSRYGNGLKQLAEDAVQDVFEDLPSLLIGFRGRSRFGTFLEAVIKIKCMQQLRKELKHKRKRTESGEDLGCELLDSLPSRNGNLPLDYLEKQELRDLVVGVHGPFWEFASALDECEQEILTLAYGTYPRKWKEIAHKIGTEEPTAKRRRDRLRWKFQDNLFPDLFGTYFNDSKNENHGYRILYFRFCRRFEVSQIACVMELPERDVNKRISKFTDNVLRMLVSAKASAG